MEKTMRKIVPALLILLVAAAMIGTSTYAWFSMNNKVTVTGMTVTTRVDENMMIVSDTLTSTTRKDDEEFGNAVVQSVSALLEPVSTVDGDIFYFTDKRNVKGNGDAMNDVYTRYDPSDVDSVTAFTDNYRTTEAVGYVDYVFQLKAVSDVAASEIRLTKLDLTYGGAATTVKVGNKPTEGTEAYRVAIFYEDITNNAPHGNDLSYFTRLAMFKTANAKNFTSGTTTAYKAVNGGTTLADVTYCSKDTTAKIPIATGVTKYYKIVVRLWLEGEDTTCKNDTYIRLNDEWKLDVEFNLVTADERANSVVYINQGTTEHKTTVGTDQEIATTPSHVINEVNYYAVTGKTLVATGEQLYVTSTDPITPDTLYYVISSPDGLYPTDVTNRVEFSATVVDSTYAAVTLDGGKLVKDQVATSITPATYAWKNADGSAAIGDNDDASYTPTASGTYFCYITATDKKVYKTASYTVVNADALSNGDAIVTLYDATSYQWKDSDGVDVTGGNKQTLKGSVAVDAGTYYCFVVKDAKNYYSLPITVVEATASADKGTVTLDEGKLSNGVAANTYAWKTAGGATAAGEHDAYEYTAEESGSFYCVVTGTDGKYYKTAVVALTVEP